MDDDACILDGFAPVKVFATSNRVTPRTVDRYRAEGLPWVSWGGRTYIGPLDEARQWLEARVRRTSSSLAP